MAHHVHVHLPRRSGDAGRHYLSAPRSADEAFEKLVRSLAARRDDLSGEDCAAIDAAVRDPKALAAWIGRRSLGKEEFQLRAAAGRRK